MLWLLSSTLTTKTIVVVSKNTTRAIKASSPGRIGKENGTAIGL
jgi:hypothetical protein